MALFTFDAGDSELIVDFFEDYKDLYEAAESNILKLEHEPNNAELLNALFRAVHTIKGNCGLLGIYPLVDLLQSVESVLDMVRHGDIAFQPLIGDLTLLVLDRCSSFIAALERNMEAEYDGGLFSVVASQINNGLTSNAKNPIPALTRALTLLDPLTSQLQADGDGESLFERFKITATDDLEFILQLAEQTQSRAAFWHGRIARVMSWIMSLNNQMGQPVDPEQLFVAVCLHDIGMAMLPSDVINKSAQLTELERQSVQDHVWVASRLASSFPRWHVAKKIIDHHQENFDGSGYPLALKGDEICVGAQMLAVVHAFEAITHGYSKSLSRKRPLMRAVMELNRYSGVQFNPKWVTAFMQITRENRDDV